MGFFALGTGTRRALRVHSKLAGRGTSDTGIHFKFNGSRRSRVHRLQIYFVLSKKWNLLGMPTDPLIGITNFILYM